MTTEHINFRHSTFSVTDGVAEFSHQRPVQRNALSAELRHDYADMLDHVEHDPGIHALVITGSGGSFCAGGDLKAVKERLSGSGSTKSAGLSMRANLQDAHVWLDRLRQLDLPVIAAVDGPAYGAGASLALAADFILASRRAAFCMSFLKIGMIPDMGALHTVPRLVGTAVARDLLLTARRVEAEEARRLGLVRDVVDADALLPEARRLARRFRNVPRGALGVTKRLLNVSMETPYALLAQLEANAQGVETGSAYHAETLERFLRGEPPLFDWDREA
ncbi:enoyl-CoA hydratase/isomerase family protein [Cupriavidus taiwanensis]|uniref:Enoyl-CoA hydratase EchA n=1 Tax=Cupriavidus taiwanensis TaxID=164546 RepID=A0A7Z7JF94_9BURK|nr:enoyl-CoA hydratase/isomerase family protein [Cupriavidus taiwanensis]SOZ17126.1 Enoyl-CoA hydratase EchA [Cupriavidus taiwanensis]SOZ96221.1 Enoyl-CoA hydratase EchA [Cupriavidus taiwanensis]SPC25510.1 Enoyl-CoA hydratase EchA [Cupriavidus taiwanensis]